MASKKLRMSAIQKALIKEGEELRAKIDQIAEDNGDEEMLVADGLDPAIVGVTEASEPVVVYDYDKCIEVFRIIDKMDEEDAIEHMSFNVTGAYVGRRTPIFVRFV